jgi:hypothetical protein
VTSPSSFPPSRFNDSPAARHRTDGSFPPVDACRSDNDALGLTNALDSAHTANASHCRPRPRAIYRADETMSRMRKTTKDLHEGVRVCINSPSTIARAMMKAMMKWETNIFDQEGGLTR